MPAASMARTADARLCIFHKNVPDMIAKITTALSAKGVNIENMVNSGRKGCPLAYTMIDMDAVPDGLLDAIGSIEGIKRIRIV